MMTCSKLQTATAAMFLVALVIWLPAVAQDRVTDTELLAAYCLGVTTAQFETQSAELASLRAQARAKTISEADRLFLAGEVLGNEEINKIIRRNAPAGMSVNLQCALP